MYISIIFLDKIFWKRIWSPLVGCISQSVTTIISFVIIGYLNNSLKLESEVLRRIVVISVVMNILVNGGILLIEGWFMLKTHSIFRTPIDRFSNFREVKAHLSNYQERDVYVKYGLPTLLIFLNFTAFIVPYILGEEWFLALLNSVLVILPFHIAFLTVHVVRVIIEIGLLLFRQILSR